MKNFIIYGFGGLGEKFYHYIQDKNFNVISILDKSKIGKNFNGIVIQNPEIFDNKKLPVIITILNEYANVDDIKKYLLNLGYEKVYTIFDAIIEFNFLDFQHLFVIHPKYFQNNEIEQNILKVKNLLSDDESKQIFDAILEFRKTFNYEHINHFYDANMYLPPPVISMVKQLDQVNLVDCGACIGDLIDLFSSKDIAIKNYYPFEPDDSNLDKLRSKIIKSNTNSCVFPMGVGNFNGLIGFNSGSGTGCNIDENSENKILVTKVDDVILNHNINFVKMDIEGFENEALEGMKKIIQKNKPILAISIYHKPFDFIDIPLSLSRIMKKHTSEYIENLDSTSSCMQYENYYIRYHGAYGFEFVLYAW